jgi:hypothetical protein
MLTFVKTKKGHYNIKTPDGTWVASINKSGDHWCFLSDGNTEFKTDTLREIIQFMGELKDDN